MADTVDLQQPIASVIPFLRKLLTSEPQGPPAPPPDPGDAPPPLQMPQQAAPPALQVTQQQPGDVSALGNLAQVPQPDQGAPKLAGETKGHKLLRILMGGAMGAGAGAGQMTFGGGMQQAQMLPLQVQHQQLQNEQTRQMLPFLRAQQIAGLGKTQAETQKFTAEAAAIPIKQKLEQAQTEAAYYKDDPNMGLIDIRTGQPVNPAGMAPLTPEQAQVLGKQPGDKVPLKLKNTADEIVNRGIRSVSANGRQMLVDSKGNTIKDLGTATPMAVINATNPMAGAPTNPAAGAGGPATGEDALKGYTPQQQNIIRGIAHYDLDPNMVKSNRNPAATATLMAAVRQYNPAYDVTAFAEKGKLRADIAKQSTALNTATHHLDLLNQAIDDLNNHDVNALNKIGNFFKVQLGNNEVTNFNAIKTAVAGELSKVFKGSATDKEIEAQNANLNAASSPEQLRGAVQKYLQLMQGRLSGLEETYEGQIGIKPNFQIVSPRAQAIFDSAGVGGHGKYTAPAGAPTATGPNNHKIVFDSGKWVDATTGQPI